MTAETTSAAYPPPVMTAHVEGMTDLERLLAIEEIKQLKARYFRSMDTKDWDNFEATMAPDVDFDLREGIAARDPKTGELRRSGAIGFAEDQIREEDWHTIGARAVRDWEAGILEHWTTVHQGHCPEIEILTPTTAKGLWHMEDRLRVPPEGRLRGHVVAARSHAAARAARLRDLSRDLRADRWTLGDQDAGTEAPPRGHRLNCGFGHD